jgi:hypothetical protein
MAVHIVLVERVIHTLPEYILGYMPSKSAKTLLTVKVDKNLKADAQVTADRLGLPLGTIINAFLLQLVRDTSISRLISDKKSDFYFSSLTIASLRKILSKNTSLLITLLSETRYVIFNRCMK